MDHKVEIFTASYCGWCHKSKDLLNKNGIEFIEYQVDAKATNDLNSVFSNCIKQNSDFVSSESDILAILKECLGDTGRVTEMFNNAVAESILLPEINANFLAVVSEHNNGKGSIPQILIDGHYLGGFTQLSACNDFDGTMNECFDAFVSHMSI